jgi:hypothetical protein
LSTSLRDTGLEYKENPSQQVFALEILAMLAASLAKRLLEQRCQLNKKENKRITTTTTTTTIIIIIIILNNNNIYLFFRFKFVAAVVLIRTASAMNR